ncbi:MAG: response regulator [Polyangiaceae bacterium]
MVLMLSGLLLGRRAMLTLSLATCLVLLSIGWAMVHGRIPAPLPENVSMTSAMPWLRTIGVTYLAIWLFGSLVIAVVSQLTETIERVQAEVERRERAERARAAAEIAALEAKQMETIGRLAAGVAHDFNNNLTAITGCAELLKVDLENSPSQLALTDEILGASQRAAELTRQLLAYSRKAHTPTKTVDLEQVVRDTVALAKRSTDPRIGIELELELDAAGAKVFGDPTLLHNAVLNLVLNARDAMPSGGRVLVSARPYELSARSSRFNPKLEPGSYILVEIEDTGTGIPAEVLPRIFEPFFTTKAVGKGTGLGLAAVLGTVRSFGGGIEVDSQVGRGSTFRLLFPRRSAAATNSSSPAATDAVRGEGKILVVDDEAAVRGTAVAALGTLGYTVSEADDGAQAIELARAASFDLVLLDLKMPSLSGEATFEQLRALHPRLRVLLWSGYGDEHDVAQMMARGALGFVQKPCALGELSRAVKSALKRHA